MKLIINLSDPMDASKFDKDIPEGVSVSYTPPIVRKMLGVEIDPVTVVVTSLTGIPTGLLINWLYDKLIKCKSNKITINRKTINFDKGAIAQIIEETIQSE